MSGVSNKETLNFGPGLPTVEIENTNENNITHNESSTLKPPSPKNNKKRPPMKPMKPMKPIPNINTSGGGEQKENLIKTYFTNLSDNFFRKRKFKDFGEVESEEFDEKIV